jgi:hypothetical protein
MIPASDATPLVESITFNDGPYPFEDMVLFLAFSCDLGTIQAMQDPIVLAIGYTTDPAVSYANQSASSSQERRPYYKSQYADDESLVTLSNFEQVLFLISCFRLLTF